jgi:hypothetical protein
VFEQGEQGFFLPGKVVGLGDFVVAELFGVLQFFPFFDDEVDFVFFVVGKVVVGRWRFFFPYVIFCQVFVYFFGNTFPVVVDFFRFFVFRECDFRVDFEIKAIKINFDIFVVISHFVNVEIDFNGLDFEIDPKIALTKDEKTKKIDDNWKGIAKKINKHLTKNYVREKKTPATDHHLSNDEKDEIDLIIKKRKKLQDAEELRNNEITKTDDLTRKKKALLALLMWKNANKTEKIKEIYGKTHIDLANRRMARKKGIFIGTKIGENLHQNQTYIIHNTEAEKNLKGPKKTHEEKKDRNRKKADFIKEEKNLTDQILELLEENTLNLTGISLRFENFQGLNLTEVVKHKVKALEILEA